MKFERSDVNYPLWRKKVDSSLFRQNGTTIPYWACKMWGIEKEFCACTSKSHAESEVSVEFKEKKYNGWVTVAKEGRTIWLKPAVVCEIIYQTVTKDCKLRLPRFHRVRLDKAPNECTINQIAGKGKCVMN